MYVDVVVWNFKLVCEVFTYTVMHVMSTNCTVFSHACTEYYKIYRPITADFLCSFASPGHVCEGETERISFGMHS